MARLILALRHERSALAAVLLLGLLVRLPFASIDYRASSDLQEFRTWQDQAQAVGLDRIYQDGAVAYPPVWPYWLALSGWIRGQIPSGLMERDALRTALIKLPSILADVVTAGLIALSLRRVSPLASIAGASAYVFNPAIWYVSAYWGQIDSVYSVFLVASLVAMDQGASVMAWLAYVLALATKQQSIALLPLLLAMSARAHTARVGALAAGAAGMILLSPWLLSGRIGDVVSVMAQWPNVSPRVDVSGYNLWYLLLLGRVHNLSSELHPLGLPVTYQAIAAILFSGYVLLAVVLGVRSGRVALAAAALSLGVFMLLSEVHERYMFPALAFLLIASEQSKRMWLAYGVLSATFLFNLVTVSPFTSLLGTNLVATEPATVADWVSKVLALLCAAVNLGALVWLTSALAVRPETQRGTIIAPAPTG